MKLTGKAIKLSKRLGLKTSDRFVIMCHQRSGSNMLTSMLMQHPRVDFFGQLFKHDSEFREFIAQFDVPYFKGHLFDDTIDSRNRFDYLEDHKQKREERNTAAFVNAYFKQRDKFSSATQTAIKFHGGTLYQDEIESIFLNGDYKVIIQHRKNLLATAISWYQARELDQWRRLNREEVVRPKLEMNIDTLRWFIENTKKDVALWKKLAAEKGIGYLELVYEDLIEADFKFSEIWNYLEVKDLGDMQPNTKKLIKSYDHITNIEAIKRTLESHENGFL